MISKIKVLGLALFLMLAMAIAATSASAVVTFHSEASTTTVRGVQEGTNTISYDSGTLHCTTATFVGVSNGVTTTAISLTPFWSGCNSTGYIEAGITLDTNGCKLTFTADGTNAANNSVHITGCDAGKAGIQTTAPFCTTTFTPQAMGPVHYLQSGTGTTREIIIELTIANITYHESGFACKNPGATTTGGKYTGKIRLTGENTGTGVHVGLRVE